MLRPILLSAPLLFLVFGLAQGEDKEPAAKKSMLKAKLVAKQKAYTLDPAHEGDAFRRRVKDAQEGDDVGELPAPPVVDLVLELKNPTDKPVILVVGSDAGSLELVLKGAGAVTGPGQRIFTREFRLGKKVEIPPGKTHEIPIKQLAHGFRGVAQYSYWTEPGKYTLSATYTWPDPSSEEMVRKLQASAEPIEITVKASE